MNFLRNFLESSVPFIVRIRIQEANYLRIHGIPDLQHLYLRREGRWPEVSLAGGERTRGGGGKGKGEEGAKKKDGARKL